MRFQGSIPAACRPSRWPAAAEFDNVRLAASGNRVFVMYDSVLDALTTF
ncbi:hypothetical protein ACWDXT_28395 [Streptomyces sp. NPDC003236]